MPLWGRAKATQANSRILADPKAVEIVERLGINLQDFDRLLHPSNALFTIARARALDDRVRRFLLKHPRTTVVNLGAGLDTGFYRIDNGILQWYDVDLPQVIELRKGLIPETDRNPYVSGSILEAGWVKDITPRSQDVYFLASGVIAYLSKMDIQRLFSILYNSFLGSEIAFDVQSPIMNFFGNRSIKAAGMGSVHFLWGAFSAKSVRHLLKGIGEIEVLEEFGIFSRFSESDFPDSNAWRMAKMMERMHIMTIVQLSLGK